MLNSMLPEAIQHLGETFFLRWSLPRIWTQRSGRPFGIYWSKELRCGALYPYPTDDELEAFYDIETYSQYLSGGCARADRVEPSLIAKLVFKLAYWMDRGVEDAMPGVLRTSRPRVCDIGCGSGHFLSRLAPYARERVGIDPSPVSVEAVQMRGLECYLGAAEDLPPAIAGKTFEVVTMFHSLEHCRDPERALRNAASLLTADGTLVVEVPNMDCLGFRTYRQVWYHTDAGRHLHFFTPHALHALAQRVGLKCTKTEFSSFARQFSRNWISSMQEVWDRLYADRPRVSDTPPRASMGRSIAFLVMASCASRRLRYDAVRCYFVRA